MNFSQFNYTYESMLPELLENSIYSTPAEREDLLKDKGKIAEIFISNFLGILGMLNANSHPRDIRALNKYFRQDKKVRLSSIDDDNNDMSLAVKLAHEAGFFKSDTIVNQITRFLAKAKLGQMQTIDTSIVAEWLAGMKPEFLQSIKDPQVRKLITDLKKDAGDTIDISSVPVLLKRKLKKLETPGEFGVFARKFRLIKRTPAEIKAMTDGTAVDPSKNVAATQSKSTSGTIDTTKTTDAPLTIATPGQSTSGTISTIKVKTKDIKPDIFNELQIRISADKFFSATVPLFSTSINGLSSSMPFENYVDLVKKVSPGVLRRKADLEYFKKFFDNGMISEEVSKIYSNTLTQLTPTINLITEKLNALNLFDRQVTKSEVVNHISTKYGRVGISDEKISVKLVKLIYEKETSGTIDKFVDTANLKAYMTVLDSSKYSVAPQVIRDLMKFLTLDEWSGYGGSKNEGLFNYLIIAESQNKTFTDMFQYINDTYKNSYKGDRVIASLLDVLFLDISDAKDLAPASFAGYSLHRTLNLHINQLINLDYAKYPEIRSKLLELRYAPYDNSVKDTIKLIPGITAYYKQDILDKGLTDSKYMKDAGVYTLKRSSSIKKLLVDLDIDFATLVTKHSTDKKVIEIQIEVNGIDSLSDPVLKAYTKESVLSMLRNTFNNTGMTDDEIVALPRFAILLGNEMIRLFRKSNDTSKISNMFLDFMKENPATYDNDQAFNSIMRLLPKMSKDEILDIVRVAKKNNYSNFFSQDNYKNTRTRDEKSEFVSIFTGILNDSIGTDLEDYVSDILEQMPGGVTGKIRDSLIGANKLIDEVNTGAIQPFGTIDDKRMKIMLSMNDINFGSLVTSSVGRRKRGEKWKDYFNRAKASNINSSSALGDELVTLANEDVTKITKLYNKSFRSGNHGDVYTKFNKVYTSSLKYPEFDDFRKNNFGDGTITPAFHGTGGIAASMILRYGFKVIKSSDSSVVGRMLGSGIYFSNKLDKAMQYVSNGGFGRSIGSKGYILEVDTTLGQLDTTRGSGPDYRAMGLGGDNIRSPEWCVRDPKKQLAVLKVYEVELSNKRLYEQYINEEKALKGFKNYLEERSLMNMNTGVTSFTFRDGLLPIFTENTETGEPVLSFVDFEEALERKLIPPDNIDYSSQGPVVVFDGTKKTQGFDIRFAEVMDRTEANEYKNLFLEKILKI